MRGRIEAGIPYPGKGGRGGKRYPWRTLNIGESFFCENAGTARANCSHFGTLLGRKFVSRAETRTIDNKPVKGARVWRMPMPGEDMPDLAEPRARVGKYPWAKVAVGESFFVARRETAEKGSREHGERLRREFRVEPERQYTIGADGGRKLILGARVIRVA